MDDPSEVHVTKFIDWLDDLMGLGAKEADLIGEELWKMVKAIERT